AKIGNLEVDTIKINYGAVGGYATGSGSGSHTGGIGAWTTIATVTINNESGLIPVLQLVGSISAHGAEGGGTISCRVVRTANLGNVLYSDSLHVGSGGNGSKGMRPMFMDTQWVAGTSTYAFQITV